MAFYSKGYVDLKYRPKPTDMVCSFTLKPAAGVSVEEAAGAVAGESSVGTWTDVSTSSPRIRAMGAKVFSIKGRWIEVAYPQELFENGNMAQIFSSIAGNVFGMKVLDSLRLEDVQFSKHLADSFGGPEVGLDDIRKLTGIQDRPLAGTIFKPKLGLTPSQMAKNAYIVYSNGIDWTKDDENLGSMRFNKFEDRVIKMLEVVDKINSEQNRRVIYAANATSSAENIIARAQFIKDHGGKCVMLDILTAGWAALQNLRNQNFKLIIHAHRASHAAVTRNKEHGISMMVLAKAARMIGVSALHTGTANVGKMESGEGETEKINAFLQSKFYKLKPVMSIASGGLHPGMISSLINKLGKNLIINCGGGLWGHPMGAAAGATAIRQAIDAAVQKISLHTYAKTHKELKVAIEKWGVL